MDLTQYWFMFPVALAIATLANATGVEGAIFFSPVFILALQLDPQIAIGTAIITQTFGFGSSVAAYARRRLIDYTLAAPLLIATVPLALAGTRLASSFSPQALKIGFGVGLLIIGALFLREPRWGAGRADEKSDGVSNPLEGMVICGIGGLFLGLVGSGLGPLNGVYLLRRRRIPGQIAVATSVLVIAITGFAASLGYLLTFVHTGGDVMEQVQRLVIYTVPGVLIGGQIAPFVSGRLDKHKLERLLAVLFLFIGGITLWTTWRGTL